MQTSPTPWLACLIAILGILLLAAWLIYSPRSDGKPRPLLGILLFGIAGPPLGMLALVVLATLNGDSPNNPGVLLFLLLPAYVIGLLPAMLSGALMGLLRPRLSLAMALPTGAALGALCAGGMFLLLGAAEPGPQLFLGAVPGLLCSALLYWKNTPSAA